MTSLGAVARVVLPVVLGGAVHSAVIGGDLLPWLKKPLDFGARLRGEPLLGANKTFRGLVVMPLASALSALALASTWGPNAYPPGFAFLATPGPAFRFGLLAGTGYVLAELPNSFIKRRLHIPPGGRPTGIGKAFSYMADQADSVAGIVLLVWVVYRPPRPLLASILVTGILAHVGVDLLLYLFGVKGSKGVSKLPASGALTSESISVGESVGTIKR
jgi:hypothetical protein